MKIENTNQALLLIDVQQGFLDSNYWGERNNPAMEKNIEDLLKMYRALKLPVIHIQHLSAEPRSPLRPGQNGVNFIKGLEPQLGERVFQKNVNSAFIGTQLAYYLKSIKINSLVITGLTTDHCVSTTARMAANLGYEVLIPHDATATFNRVGHTGITYSAELVHQVSLSSLEKEFAKVLSVVNIKKYLSDL